MLNITDDVSPPDEWGTAAPSCMAGELPTDDEKTCYYARIAHDGRKQLLKDHLLNTAKLAGTYARAFGAEVAGYVAGLLHDTGKYSLAFQKRLVGLVQKVDHVSAGAWEALQQKWPVISYIITGHHGGLRRWSSADPALSPYTYLGMIRLARDHKIEPYDGWKTEIVLPPAVPEQIGKDKIDLYAYTLILYSCLVDADWTDAANFERGGPLQMNCADIETLYERLNVYINEFSKPDSEPNAEHNAPLEELNAKRNALLQACIKKGADENCSSSLFTLTAPTGSGKTLSMLAFGLRLASTRKMDRIIIVEPRICIIEEIAAQLRKILGAENVLEHHSDAAWLTGEYGDDDSEMMLLCRAAAENWDMPVIVTTTVQFFESFFSATPARCRKLHNTTHSVIIFDEVQALQLGYLRPCVCIMAELVKHFRSAVVLSTATQPALETLFGEFLEDFSGTNSTCSPVELCPPGIAVDPIFQRVHYEFLGTVSWERIAARMNEKEQVLCIVNTRRDAQRLYQMLEPEGRYHLSNAMTPADKESTLTVVRERLKAGKTVRLAATQVAENGINVSFRYGYAAISGLVDALQVAGRINRNWECTPHLGTLAIFKPETKQPLEFSAAAGITEKILGELQSIDDITKPEIIRQYFEELLDIYGDSGLDKDGIIRIISQENQLEDEREQMPFRTVAEKVHFIDKMWTVYIPCEGNRELIERLKAGKADRSTLRQMSRYGVSVHNEYLNQLLKRNAAKKLKGREDVVLTDVSLYSKETGLRVQLEE